jgi:predicted nucleic acid binding AN1-type Zn finger protein
VLQTLDQRGPREADEEPFSCVNAHTCTSAPDTFSWRSRRSNELVCAAHRLRIVCDCGTQTEQRFGVIQYRVFCKGVVSSGDCIALGVILPT